MSAHGVEVDCSGYMVRGYVAERGEVSRDARVRIGRQCKTDIMLDYLNRECGSREAA
jgi:hypothetical protein